jgi:hypothetical protein
VNECSTVKFSQLNIRRDKVLPIGQMPVIVSRLEMLSVGALIPGRMSLSARYSRAGVGRRGWLSHDHGSFTALFAGNDP